ncbi:hypothetical protein CKF62_05835 [Corynebacterium striatum]|nr:hypothetical protein CKF62_05835 [Corynebacterium striatum]
MLCKYHNMKKRDGDVYCKGEDGRIYKRREFGPAVPCPQRQQPSLQRERPAPHEGKRVAWRV